MIWKYFPLYEKAQPFMKTRFSFLQRIVSKSMPAVSWIKEFGADPPKTRQDRFSYVGGGFK